MIASRRGFLGVASVAVALGASGGLTRALASVGAQCRSLNLHNLHTGERLAVDYCVDGRYVDGALLAVNNVLRDFRTGDVHPIDPKLLDLLNLVGGSLETNATFEVISGYRSPLTNAALREHSSGVAANSLHMKGMAIDVRLPGRSLESLHATALAMRAGGVGYYPQSDFVHMDVGRVRTW